MSDSELDTVTPKVLVQYTIYAPGGDEVDHRAYDSIQPQGTVGDTMLHDAEVIGYAEFEPYTQLDRHLDVHEFKAEIEEKAEYFHWK